MPDTIIPDTSCLIALAALGRLDLLSRFHSVVMVPAAVKDEYSEALPEWIIVEPVTNPWLVKSLRMTLGKGEAEAISLATQVSGSLVVLDDERARREARGLGLVLTGTLGILIRAKQEGLLSSLMEALKTLDVAGFRVSDDLRREVLAFAGEA